MDVKVGDIFESSSNKMDFAVKKIVDNMVVLESPDRKKQILTGVNTLKLKTFDCPFRSPGFKYRPE